MLPGRRPGRGAALALALVLTACATAPALRYTPDRQPAGVVLSADYALAGDRLRVEIDSGAYRIEEALILREDGTAVPAQILEQPDGRDGGGFSIGVGVGSARRVGSVGVGAGVGTGTAIGRRGEATAFATFPLAAVGPGPWRLRVKVVGIEPVLIVLDPALRR